VFIVTKQQFDIAVNLCKDQEAAMLLSECNAKQKFGFLWSEGHLSIANPESEHKLLTGLFDSYSKANTKSYVEEIFEICGFDYQQEPYSLNVDSKQMDHWSYLKESAQNKPIIGLNTGAGSRWPTRLWPEENWKQLIVALKNAGYAPLLLGGNDEHERNIALKQETGAMYEGVFPLETFIAISAQCDVIVTAVSMTMHIALGLGKKMVLFNNIFNKHEFDVFGRGEIIEPETGCDCYYGAQCSRERICMKDISVNTVFAAIERQIS
jgi:heptosyltransferase-2